MKKLLLVIPIIAISVTSYFFFSTPEPPSSTQGFIIDSGYRADYASNPFVISNDSDTLTLAYELRSERLKSSPSERVQIVTTTDGLDFTPVTSNLPQVVPAAILLPNGTYRRYHYDATQGGLVSESSTNGKMYANDPGVRYAVATDDQQAENIFGVSTYFLDADGGVVLLYNVTDENDDVVVNRAYADPETNGLTFELEKTDVLDGTIEDEHYADPHSIVLSNGNVWLIVMNQTKGAKPPLGRQGVIYGYESTDGGKTFGGARRLFGWDDVDEFDVYSLNDPKIVEFPEGNIRIYVAAMIPDTSVNAPEKYKWIVISALAEL